MQKKRNQVLVCFILICAVETSAQTASVSRSTVPAANTVTVPVGGNTWSSGKDKRSGSVTNSGIQNWTEDTIQFSTYVRVATPGVFRLGLTGKTGDANSVISVNALGKSVQVKLPSGEFSAVDAGEWRVKDTGYFMITLAGVKKTGNVFADISALQLSGSAINAKTTFVKNNEGNFFYWGRRGPSVHLSYTMPANTDAEWFYNEITVPKDNDVIGSYYMANGFGEGYFGIQVNSPTERRILFSVWSPFQTDDPKQIPEDQKIIMLKKGEGVHTGEFGNEGSGGQSYLRYMWKAGTTYRFLLKGVPDGDAHTIYTAYFYAPEKGDWMLIASFRRPKKATYLTRFHSFLENFSPEQGKYGRQVLFTNQWMRDKHGAWHELNKARFTGDNTARTGFRMDYAGGLKGNAFFLRNCGFFNDYTAINAQFERPLTRKAPEIDFAKLP